MSSEVKHNKVVGVLPATLEKDSIYYVKTGFGFDLYVTDKYAIRAIPINTPLSSDNFIALSNEEIFSIPKGTPVFSTGTGYKRAQANDSNCKKILGLTAFDTPSQALGLVQVKSTIVFNSTEWSIITGMVGGIGNSAYWLSSVMPGYLSTTSPNENNSPSWALKLGYGINNTTFSIDIQPSVKL